MGILDLFLSEERQIDRHIRRLNNRDSTAEDREASARWLAEKATPKCLMGLLQRFELNLDHQLKDAGEKELVYSLLVGKGAACVEPARAFLRSCKQFAMPLKLVGEVGGADAQFAAVLDMLETERKKDDFKPEKKRALLVWLADQRRPECVDVARPFLADFDEGVRYAAAEAIVAQSSSDARAALEAVFSNPREESNRLKIRVATIFAQRNWSLDEALAERLPSGFRFREGRVVSA
jgi:hypothetical protein